MIWRGYNCIGLDFKIVDKSIYFLQHSGFFFFFTIETTAVHLTSDKWYAQLYKVTEKNLKLWILNMNIHLLSASNDARYCFKPTKHKHNNLSAFHSLVK